MWQDYKETILKPDTIINGTTYHHTGFMFLRDDQWLYEYMSDNGKVAYIIQQLNKLKLSIDKETKMCNNPCQVDKLNLFNEKQI